MTEEELKVLVVCVNIRVYYDALDKGIINIPAGKYLVADAGYSSIDGLLLPYPGVRYHLKEWSQGNDRYKLLI
jgi:hypothetical protein